MWLQSSNQQDALYSPPIKSTDHKTDKHLHTFEHLHMSINSSQEQSDEGLTVNLKPSVTNRFGIKQQKKLAGIYIAF